MANKKKLIDVPEQENVAPDTIETNQQGRDDGIGPQDANAVIITLCPIVYRRTRPNEERSGKYNTHANGASIGKSCRVRNGSLTRWDAQQSGCPGGRP